MDSDGGIGGPGGGGGLQIIIESAAATVTPIQSPALADSVSHARAAGLRPRRTQPARHRDLDKLWWTRRDSELDAATDATGMP